MTAMPHDTCRPPLVALVGRPNVGKSTLFNRLVGRRQALVHDTPGVTRDRIFGEMCDNQRVVRLVDTGGLVPSCDAEDRLTQGIGVQTRLAIEAADLVVLVVDARAGLLPDDVAVQRELRRLGKPVILAANKLDTPRVAAWQAEFHALGVDTVLSVSAEHGLGIAELRDVLCARLNPPARQEVQSLYGPLPVRTDEPPGGAPSQVEWHGGAVRVAVVGRPNAGKSSLINRLVGEPRHLASPDAGTTRDAVDSEITLNGQAYVFVDTAGVRRKRSIDSRLEQFAVVSAFDSMDRSDVVVVLLDGTVRPTDQDARIAAMAHDKGRGVLLVVNKWDLVSNPEWRERYLKALRLQLPFADYVDIVTVSAKTGAGVRRMLEHVLAAQRERHRRVGTGELNRFLRSVVASHPPPVRGGKRPHLFFVSQPLVRPPTFVFAARGTEGMHFSYVRYLQNALRQRYGFGGTPIWLKFRPKNKTDAVTPRRAVKTPSPTQRGG